MTRRAARAVLGLCAYTHDSAAALLLDGRLAGFCEEERLSGRKHDARYPEHAVNWLLDRHGLTSSDVDVVAYNFAPSRYLRAVPSSVRYLFAPATASRAPARARGFTTVAARTRHRLRSLAQRFPHAQVDAVPHHRAHGMYAFAASEASTPGATDDTPAAVLVVDSLGETETTTIATARLAAGDVQYRQHSALHDPASLGYVYGAVTEHLGWRRGDEEGTVMALAALGDPTRFRELFTRAVPLTDTGFRVDPTQFALRTMVRGARRVGDDFVAGTCPARDDDEPLTQTHADLAAALQERTTIVMSHLARQARRLTGAAVLCLGGGVATNCVSIGHVADSGVFEQIEVPPAPGDSGTAIGAALAAWHRRTGQLADGVRGACYLGPDFTGIELDACPRPGLRAERVDELAPRLADALAKGQIVGLFAGALEAGPRALGHRSILASPLDADVVERLNATVKYREPFRPFAPVVTVENAERFFQLTSPSPFMSRAAKVTEHARRTVPSIVHANGTARVQSVSAGQDPLLAAVLDHFAALTGVPVLINTSLNIKSKPICGTPEMALDCLVESGIDALLLEHWWVTR